SPKVGTSMTVSGRGVTIQDRFPELTEVLRHALSVFAAVDPDLSAAELAQASLRIDLSAARCRHRGGADMGLDVPAVGAGGVARACGAAADGRRSGPTLGGDAPFGPVSPAAPYRPGDRAGHRPLCTGLGVDCPRAMASAGRADRLALADHHRSVPFVGVLLRSGPAVA